MNAIKDENLLAGSTAEAPDGRRSSPVMRDGEEPPDTLLALLNNVLPSMVDSQQVKIIGTGKIEGLVGTLIIVYGVVPTANNLLVTKQPTEEK